MRPPIAPTSAGPDHHPVIGHRIPRASSLCGALAALCFLIAAPRAAAVTDPSRVLVVYQSNSPDTDNNGVPDSLQLAQYYAAKRGVPAANLLGLNISVSSSYGTGQYSTFYSEMVAPIQNALATLGPTNIDIILLAGQLPTLFYDGAGNPFSVDSALMAINTLGSDPNTALSAGANPYFDPAPGFDTPPGHFSHAAFQYNGTTMYLVTRLGGDSNLRGIGAVDQSLYAGLYLYPQPGYFYGNAYVNSLYGQPGTGLPYTDDFLAEQPVVQGGDYDTDSHADMNIAYAEHYILGSGFPLKWLNSTTSQEIGDPGATFTDGTSAATAPQALFYGGWYNFDQYNNVWQWLPGSVACDLNSSSYFALEALQHGASAACYAVYEPDLGGATRPNILYYYLLAGYEYAEAAALATPALDWETINEGDPLYAPLQTKTPVTDTQLPVLSQGYPAIAANPAANTAVMTLQVMDTPEPEVATAQVAYGPDSSYGSVSASQSGFTLAPTVSLPWNAGQLYHYQVTLTDPVGNTTTSGDLIYDPNAPPTVVNSASATPNPVNGTTTNLSVLGADDSGEVNLTYTWSASGPAPVTFSSNGANGSQNTIATFSQSGSYNIQVLIADALGMTATSTVTVVVINDTTPPSVSMTAPASGAVVSGTVAVTASATDASGISGVQFQLDGVNLGSAVTGGGPSYSYSWNSLTASNGSHTLSAVATDTAGNQATSSVTVTVDNSTGPAVLLEIAGNQAELSGLTNGSVVTPAVTPSGFSGTVQVNGSGSVNFAPGGSGVYFLNCCGNANQAYYQFNGVAVGSVFNASQGQISFNLQSRYSFAQRQANAAQARAAFDVRDGSGQHQFYFMTQVSSGYLLFTYMIGTASQYYFVPQGTEDALFGSGVTLAVTLAWNGSTANLYLNGMLVQSSAYTPPTPSWTAASLFDLGAYQYQSYGGYDVSDDILSAFTVTGPPGSGGNTTPPSVSMTAPASGAVVSGTVAVTASATDASGISGVQFQLDGVNLGSAVTGAGPSYSYSWNTLTASNGSHTLSAVATDTAGNQATSSVTVTVDNSTGPAVLLEIAGNQAELSGLANGSVVTPAVTPSGFSGTVQVNGSGSVNFAPGGSGVYFLNCCGNANQAYYQFNGVAVGSVFNASQGQISFNLQSRYSFAQRQANAAQARAAFDVRDGSGQHQFYFMTQVSSGYLLFTYMIGTASQYYFVPQGTEDALFGSGVTLAVTLAWNGSTANLYLNGMLVQSSAYTPPTPSWTAASLFDLGAYQYQSYGGYDVSDDILSAFTVTGPPGSGGNTTPPSVSMTAPASGAVVSGTVAVTASATDASGISGVQFQLDGVNLGSAVTGGGPSYSYSWNSLTASNGSHTLSAVATDTAGNQATSSVTVTVDNSTGPAVLLEIAGNQAELSGLTNGSVVTPAVTPSGFSGTVQVNGSGSVNFAPGGSGVYFLNCCGNANQAYYQFNGVAVGSVFNASQGQISFNLQSRYSFAQRQANAAQARAAFDVRDGSGQHQFYFMTQVSSGYLLFTYMIGTASQYYFVPQGTEDALFGSGVTLAVTLAWNGSTANLYLNGMLVQSSAYTPPTPSWTAAALFDLGAYQYQSYGGYDVSDDILSAFTVTGPPN